MIKLFFAVACAAWVTAGCALAGPFIDKAAPAFTGAAASGATISLEQFKGRTVVLEWTNDGCPFVKKHYETGNMQGSQDAAKAAGAVWITVISSAPGNQGHADATRANALTAERSAKPDFVVLDETGAIGKAYGAKTTPHMFVIDGSGVLRYGGAIDNRPSANHATVEGASNFVLAAVNSIAPEGSRSP